MFRFSLQPVLDQRIAKEELRQREYKELQGVMEGLRQEQQTIQSDIAHQGQLVSDQLRQGISFQIRYLYESWIDYQKREVGRLNKEMDDLRPQLEERRLCLVEAARGRILIEKLQEKELEAYQKEQARVERIAFDEIGTRQFSERQRAEKSAARKERNARQ